MTVLTLCLTSYPVTASPLTSHTASPTLDLGEPSKRIFGKSWAFGPTSGPPPHTVGQNRLKGEVSISHVTSSILDVILGICVARYVCNRYKHISQLV